MKCVIVGGVAAGMSAAARLRRLDEQAEIVVFERDSDVSFANCGLPYYIGGTITERQKLLVTTPEQLHATFNIAVHTLHEVLAIDRQAKEVLVRDRVSGREFRESYDKLLLAQGAEPIRPPTPGIDLPQVHTLRNLHDMDSIKAAIDTNARRAVVIGASYIGLEVTEALRQRGLEVDLVELQPQVMPLFDAEMAELLREHLVQHGVTPHLGTAASAFRAEGDQVLVELSNGGTLSADLVLLAVGVRPVTGLAKAAGLTLGPHGGVQVDPHMRTSDPDIYAAGDMVEVTETVTGAPAVIALAGPANRQGRIVADHMAGRNSSYQSTQGTAIVKLFELTAASTGASEKLLRRVGREFRKIYVHANDHAGYYPGAQGMHIKLLFAPEDGRILGAQIIGPSGVDKRIDVLATALRAQMTVYDLEQLELAYAPPYGSAKDPVNMAGFVAANLLNGDVAFWYAEEYAERAPHSVVIDVRSPAEYLRDHIPGSYNIPLPELRDRIDEVQRLAQQGTVLVYCMVGLRSYVAYRILRQHGISDLATLSGGMQTFTGYVHEEAAVLS